MPQKTDSEKIKTCFQALGINNKAYEILFAEIVRLENDERLPEQKQVTLQVLDDGQKLIAETLLVLIEKQALGRRNSPSQIGCIKVEFGDMASQDKKPEDIIDLSGFDYESEKNKLVSRCNSTILGNRDIGDIIWEQELSAKKQPYDSKLIEELTGLREDIKSVNKRIESYESRLFVLFRETRIEDAYDEKDFLAEQLEVVERKYEREKSYRDYTSSKRKARLSEIIRKEDVLEGIKYLFTGRREELVKTTDENGKTVKAFVLKPQEDYDSPSERKSRTKTSENNTYQSSDSSTPKPIEYSDNR